MNPLRVGKRLRKLRAAPRFVLHGTVPRYVEEILSSGIIVRQHEPSFTTDLITAACLYADVATNPPLRRVAGRSSPHSPADNPSNCGAGIDDRHLGVVFVVNALPWRVVAPSTSSLQINTRSRQISGGISKWIGIYMELVPPSITNQQLAAAGSAFRSRTLHRSPSLHSTRAISVSHIVASVPVTTSLRTELLQLDQSMRCGRPWSDNALGRELSSAVGREILQTTLVTRLARTIRRITLSLARARGYVVLKTDAAHIVEEDPARFWPDSELHVRLRALQEVERHFAADTHLACAAKTLLRYASAGSATVPPLRTIERYTAFATGISTPAPVETVDG